MIYVRCCLLFVILSFSYKMKTNYLFYVASCVLSVIIHVRVRVCVFFFLVLFVKKLNFQFIFRFFKPVQNTKLHKKIILVTHNTFTCILYSLTRTHVQIFVLN
jgi:hypothetical protein